MILSGKKLHYRELNRKMKEALKEGEREFTLKEIMGHRYICAGVACRREDPVRVSIEGLPGNNLGAFMDGPEIRTSANGQDGLANTMNSGRIIVNGSSGDIAGHSMRGGEIYIRGSVGYRVGIHMKSYRDIKPKIVIGGGTGDFLGEYMAGGLIIVLALNSAVPTGYFAGTGMHGGTIFIRGEEPPRYAGKEVQISRPDDKDREILKNHISEYESLFGVELGGIYREKFIKLEPGSSRPYGKIYT